MIHTYPGRMGGATNASPVQKSLCYSPAMEGGSAAHRHVRSRVELAAALSSLRAWQLWSASSTVRSPLTLISTGKVLWIYLRLRGGSIIWSKDVKTRKIKEQLLMTKSLWILSLLNRTKTPKGWSWQSPICLHLGVLTTAGWSVSTSVTMNILQGATTLQLAFAGCGSAAQRAVGTGLRCRSWLLESNSWALAVLHIF